LGPTSPLGVKFCPWPQDSPSYAIKNCSQCDYFLPDPHHRRGLKKLSLCKRRAQIGWQGN
jgi:hypothetical protein